MIQVLKDEIVTASTGMAYRTVAGMIAEQKVYAVTVRSVADFFGLDDQNLWRRAGNNPTIARGLMVAEIATIKAQRQHNMIDLRWLPSKFGWVAGLARMGTG